MSGGGRADAAHKSRHCGFTLIELLVVVAIIAILAALLFPAYTTAKQRGQIAKCTSQQKQLYSSLVMYAQDYGSRLPGRSYLLLYSPGPGKPYTAPYMPYVRNYSILICQKTGCYGSNISLTAPVDYNSWAWVPGSVAAYVRVHKEQGHGTYPRAGRPLEDIVRPSRMMAFVCGELTRRSEEMGAAVSDIETGWEWEPHDIGEGWSSRMANRHNGGTTYVFMDGHAACLRPTGTKYEFPVATAGLDYDGDGTVGTTDFMR